MRTFLVYIYICVQIIKTDLNDCVILRRDDFPGKTRTGKRRSSVAATTIMYGLRVIDDVLTISGATAVGGVSG